MTLTNQVADALLQATDASLPASAPESRPSPTRRSHISNSKRASVSEKPDIKHSHNPHHLQIHAVLKSETTETHPTPTETKITTCTTCTYICDCDGIEEGSSKDLEMELKSQADELVETLTLMALADLQQGKTLSSEILCGAEGCTAAHVKTSHTTLARNVPAGTSRGVSRSVSRSASRSVSRQVSRVNSESILADDFFGLPPTNTPTNIVQDVDAKSVSTLATERVGSNNSVDKAAAEVEQKLNNVSKDVSTSAPCLRDPSAVSEPSSQPPLSVEEAKPHSHDNCHHVTSKDELDLVGDLAGDVKTTVTPSGTRHKTTHLDIRASASTSFKIQACESPSTTLFSLPKRHGPFSSSTTSLTSHIGQNQMQKFLSGFKRFQKTYFGDNNELYKTLRQGQSPKTLLIGCCDSRVDPAIITDCDPGDLFVVRNVANLVAPYNPDKNYHGVSAALEFAVKGLKVESIIIMGHTKCGGIEALMRGICDSDETEFLGHWMGIAQRAKDKVLKHFGHKDRKEQQRACEHASILLSLENLMTYPWVRQRLLDGVLSIHGWYFDFEAGELSGLNADTHAFEPLDEEMLGDAMGGGCQCEGETGRKKRESAFEKGGDVEEHVYTF
ncbi:hypothetical protein HDV05_006341 [Chytridiales sp. JEL 0842]|nr:hypothetical protein HDV05_006341 [Chytridiales sp. JEL 0842]